MGTRAVYHVVPSAGGWRIKLAGDSVDEFTELKSEAIERAKLLAKREALGQVVVHTQDGRIEQEFTYGQDPSRSAG